MPVSVWGVGMLTTLRADALAAWEAGLRAVDPAQAVRRAIDARPELGCGPTTGGPAMVLAVGKAATRMILGVDASRKVPHFALVPSGSSVSVPSFVRVLKGGHPVPTAHGMDCTRWILREVARLQQGQRLLLLLSGGASALLEAPAEGLSVDDLIASHRALVGSGLPIASINIVRGCLSAVKAGGLARIAAPARVTTLAISDVQGDDPATIGSGPTVQPAEGEASRCRRALALLDEAGVQLPPGARRHLEEKARGEDRLLDAVAPEGDYEVVASISTAVQAARAELDSRGYEVAPDAGYLDGDTATAAARILEGIAECGRSGQQRRALVFGGETTVALPPGATGRGGRNLDLAARLALALAGRDDVAAAVAGTDGIDGSSRAAGAVIDGGSAARAEAAGISLEAALAAFDTEPALGAAGDLLAPGPTGTNVGDLVVVTLG